ncbi:oxidoreductase [Actinocatenispora sera]|uniref:Short-chain dehydrogenase n=1 Tax=Actinocatenispora sera TaxID=390989 RepID=A0A810LAA0_9ACTN|nr:oxidoreductase [Actinocatenispora sera]BCJ31805.1 short-chain dehydrogenase [Actinocatenispora sera]
MTGTGWTAADIPDLTDRTFVVTGANSGLGLVTARQLARHGARVVLAVRDEGRGRQAAADITAAHPEASLEVRRLNLADLESVSAFATALQADGVRPDVLINNAGVMAPPRAVSPQGHELQFATNHLGHFALTGLLWDSLRRGTDPRVVTVTSDLHRGSRIHTDDLNGARSYSGWKYYRQSKFANVVFALELDRRLRAAASPVRSLLAHPGFAATNLQSSGPTGLLRLLTTLGRRLVAQDAGTGAEPQLYAATAPDVHSGQFFGPGGRREMRGHPTVVRPDPAAEDPDTARWLWQRSEELTGVSIPITTP